MTSPLTVVVVEQDRDRAIAIVDALKESGEIEVIVIGSTSGAGAKDRGAQP